MLVYVITNIAHPQRKQYVGRTIYDTPEQRWKTFDVSVDRAKQSHMPIIWAMLKYGSDAFTIEKIEDCETFEQVQDREKYWVNELDTWVNNGYNLKAGGGRGSYSEEMRRRISEWQKGTYNARMIEAGQARLQELLRLGLHPFQNSELQRANALKVRQETHQRRGQKAAETNRRNGTGLFDPNVRALAYVITKEQRTGVYSRQACGEPGCDFISNPGNVAKHRTQMGHSG